MASWAAFDYCVVGRRVGRHCGVLGSGGDVRTDGRTGGRSGYRPAGTICAFSERSATLDESRCREVAFK